MGDSFTKNAGSVLLEHGHQDLQFILGKVKKLTELSRLVSTFLDPTMLDQCQVANLAGNRLTMLAANGSVATQLRFQTQDLLRKFKQHPLLRAIQHIDCKVSPVSTQPQLPQRDAAPREVQRLSPETAALLQDMAEGLEDVRLKESILNIARHQDKKW